MNTLRLVPERPTRALVVSHFYHLPRIKMAYEHYGVNAFTVPSRNTVPSSTAVQRRARGRCILVVLRTAPRVIGNVAHGLMPTRRNDPDGDAISTLSIPTLTRRNVPATDSPIVALTISSGISKAV